jgi:hypothetical protein
VTDGLATAVAAKPVVVGVGGAFMISSEAKAAGTEHGYRGWQLYVAGRTGVLGDVRPEVVAATLGFHEPGLVRSAWAGAGRVAPTTITAARYVEVCHAWGRRRYAGLAELDRLADLLERVAAAADPAGWPLFAAWRAQSLPDDAAGRVVQLMQVLREHRGGAHLGAVRAAGLRPLEAVVAAGGSRNATFFGWPDPLPEVSDDLRARLARAEAVTDEQVAPAYAVLDTAGRDDLLRLLPELAAARARQTSAT